MEWASNTYEDFEKSERIAKSVAQGKKVQILSSFGAASWISTFMDLPLVVGNTYSVNYLVYGISRRHSFSKQITKLCVRSLSFLTR